MAAAGRERLVLIDAFSLIYRAFFAVPPMSTTRGEVTNAVHGFTNMLILVLADRPRYAAAAFDVGLPAGRLALYPEYKSGRPAMPEDLRHQVDRVKQVLEAFRIPVVSLPGFEADDVIGSLAARARDAGLEVLVVSGDLDCLQLVDSSVRALVPRRGITETMVYGPAEVKERYGLEPSQLPDYKALAGDSSDNIPGVPGIGAKTAASLLQTYGSVETLLDRLARLPAGRIRQRLEEHREEILVWKRIATIARDLEVPLDLAACDWQVYDPARLRALLEELEFRSLIPRIPPPARAPAVPASGAPGPETAFPTTVIEDPSRPLDLGGREVGAFGVTVGSGLDVRLVGLALCGGEQARYLAIGPDAATPAQVAAIVSDLGLIGHDTKELAMALSNLDAAPREWVFSASLAGHLTGEGARDPRLEDLAREKLNLALIGLDQVAGSGRSARPLDQLAPAELAGYAGGRAAALLRLRPIMEQHLRDLEVDYLYHEVELPLVPVLVAMERAGIAVDTAYLGEMSRELAAQLAEIEAEVMSLASAPFNLNAPQQLARFLFDELKLKSRKRTKTGYSTDADTLDSLREEHPIVTRILEHRQLSKLKSTYVDALPGLVGADGRVHTTFNQAATATGRLSSTNPNLMNIPVRTEIGQRIRRCFRAQSGEDVLVSADYSQIELRIAAHLSQDPALIAAFQAGEDIHAATAARVFGTSIAEVDKDQRRLAKVANFGSIYGQGVYGLSQQLAIPTDVARDFLAQYWTAYAGLKDYLDRVREEARRTGVVVNETGRRRAIPDLMSSNRQLQQAAERMAINFPIQSLAADIIKIAMVRIHRHLAAAGLRGRMLLQVHDELVFEVPRDELEEFAKFVPGIMAGAYQLTVPIVVDCKAGPNWADMEPVGA